MKLTCEAHCGEHTFHNMYINFVSGHICAHSYLCIYMSLHRYVPCTSVYICTLIHLEILHTPHTNVCMYVCMYLRNVCTYEYVCSCMALPMSILIYQIQYCFQPNQFVNGFVFKFLFMNPYPYC